MAAEKAKVQRLLDIKTLTKGRPLLEGMDCCPFLLDKISWTPWRFEARVLQPSDGGSFFEARAGPSLVHSSPHGSFRVCSVQGRVWLGLGFLGWLGRQEGVGGRLAWLWGLVGFGFKGWRTKCKERPTNKPPKANRSQRKSNRKFEKK